MSRRLGKRFGAARRAQSVLVGTLTVDSESRPLIVKRTQGDSGEQVEINLGGRQGTLIWDAAHGPLSGAIYATGSDRELIERLVLDSPDQFVLAQLRGASYFTVARNVRPENVGDEYQGAIWDVVRVDDPERDEDKKPQSAWRLYYINTRTELIDRVVCKLGGQTIEAEMSGWTEQSGESVPGLITWTRNGQTIMQYRLTNFSHMELQAAETANQN